MRNKRLDVLRCIAVLLVMLRHGYIRTRLGDAGWAGVDLFFVLSGFLISGLLFTEYKKRNSIDFKRFIIRRGLKLYPAFYVFLTATFLYQVMFHQLSSLEQYLQELFYVQNYGSGIWAHTWSLAIEEHFYIMLPLFFLLLIRYSSNRADPFQVMPQAFIVVAATCLAFRVYTVLRIPVMYLQYQYFAVTRTVYAPTHHRIDALFFGVLLGYLYHFRPQLLERLLRPKWSRMALTFLAVALLSCCFFIPLETRFMLTVGFTLTYLGFGIVLMLSLYVYGVLPSRLAKPLELVGKAFAYVGMYSYSIYLWHVPVKGFLSIFLSRFFHLRVDYRIYILYVIASLPFGIFMSRLIEYPVLRFRDRIFPRLAPERSAVEMNNKAVATVGPV